MPEHLDPFAFAAAAIAEAAAIVAAEALTREQAAAVCGLSPSKFDALVRDALAPEPVMLGLGRCPRWHKRTLAAWLRAGAPSRKLWKQIERAELRRAG